MSTLNPAQSLPLIEFATYLSRPSSRTARAVETCNLVELNTKIRGYAAPLVFEYIT